MDGGSTKYSYRCDAPHPRAGTGTCPFHGVTEAPQNFMFLINDDLRIVSTCNATHHVDSIVYSIVHATRPWALVGCDSIAKKLVILHGAGGVDDTMYPLLALTGSNEI